MSILDRVRRVWLLDLARGIFILTMLITHSIFFFHHSINPVLQWISGLGNFVSFSGLLLVSGAAVYPAYFHEEKQHQVVRILKRLFMYLVGYYCLTLYIVTVSSGWEWQAVWRILTFQQLIPFTEFIIAFLIFGMLKIPLKPLYLYAVNRPLLLVAVSIALLVTGMMLAPLPSLGPQAWKAIWVYHSHSFSFPILQYFPIYVLGLWLGKTFYSQKNVLVIKTLLEKLIQTGILLSLLLLFAGLGQGYPLRSLFERWPPSALFLTSSATVILLILWFILLLKDLASFPWTRTLLLLLGQNTFALFITHTAILYTYQYCGFPKVYSSLFVLVLTVVSIMGAFTLAKILPLNYAFVLNYWEWCECKLGFCVHSCEPSIIRHVKHGLLKLYSLPDRLVFRFRSRRVKPLHVKNLALGVVLFFIVATPLGYVENEMIKESLTVSYEGQLNRRWFIADWNSNAVYSIQKSVLPLSTPTRVTALVNQTMAYPMRETPEGWQVTIPLSNFYPGEYQIAAAMETQATLITTQTTTFAISRPVLIAWTIDWEGYDVPDNYLKELATVADFYHIPMTHLFNPRIYTDPSISEARSEALTRWVIGRQSKGEEIGLHLHMFPDLVSAAGLIPKTTPAWGGGFSPGYDVLTTAYSYEEMKTLLHYAQDMFRVKGLGVPKSYRAGGWFANSDTLRALADSGFFIDSSARTAYTFGTNKITGLWNISATQSPYFPSLTDQNVSDASAHVDVLEIPNNGADDYAFSSSDMIERFYANYALKPVSQPVQVTFLTHPQWFNSKRQHTMRQVFNEIQKHTYSDDTGPVRYSTLLGMYDYFRP